MVKVIDKPRYKSMPERGSSAVVTCSPPNHKVPGSNPGPGIVLVGYGCTTHVVVPRRSDGTLNRGPVCVRMHLRSCLDQKNLEDEAKV